ncbi:MAG: hypothetical protein GY855_15040, partial [candidate division Zixibacteria bacterium]|nr:hypothetical protein [candidate division Zixibacteria bacterium]
MKRTSISLNLILLIFLFMPIMILAQSNEDCLECHEETESEIAVGYDQNLALSIHQDFNCIDCHADLDGAELPHDEELEKIDCGMCHEAEAETYIGHGRKSIYDCVDIPCCSECHGKHDILPSTDKRSMTNPLNLPSTCGNCHEDLDL